MTTAAMHTKGVALKRGDGAGTEVFTLIAEITSFTGPTETAKQIDVTSFDSTSREFIGGLRDGGEISIEFNFVGKNAQQQGLRSDLANRVKRNFKLLLTDDPTTPTQVAFAAVLTSFSVKGGVDAAVVGSASMKLSGDPTWTYAT